MTTDPKITSLPAAQRPRREILDFVEIGQRLRAVERRLAALEKGGVTLEGRVEGLEFEPHERA